mgnify:CR=1 FL=1
MRSRTTLGGGKWLERTLGDVWEAREVIRSALLEMWAVSIRRRSTISRYQRALAHGRVATRSRGQGRGARWPGAGPIKLAADQRSVFSHL